LEKWQRHDMAKVDNVGVEFCKDRPRTGRSKEKSSPVDVIRII